LSTPPPLLIDPPMVLVPGRALLRGLLAALLIFAASRALVWTCAYTGAALRVRMAEQLEPPLVWKQKQLDALLSNPNSSLRLRMARELGHFAPLLRWDAGHYWWIVTTGYEYEPPDPGKPMEQNQWNIAFFPLYPLLCWPAAKLLGVPTALTLVANLAAFAACAAFYLWARTRLDAGGALWAVAVLALWPTSCFLSFGYAESTALLLFVLALWCADSRRFWLAALFCALASAARPTGAALVLTLGIAAFAGKRGGLRRWGTALCVCAVGAAGMIAYAAYLWAQFGSPFVYSDNFAAGWVGPNDGFRWSAWLSGAKLWEGLRYFRRAAFGFPLGLVELVNPMAWNVPLTAVLLVLSVAAMRHVPPATRPLLLLGPLIFAQRYWAAGWYTFGIESMARYVGLAAPFFLVFGAWLARGAPRGVAAGALTLLALLQATWALHFGMGEWAG